MAYILHPNVKYCKYTHTSEADCDTSPPSWGDVKSEKEFSPCEECEGEKDWTVIQRSDGTCYAEKIECIGPCDPDCCPDPPSEDKPDISVPDKCCDKYCLWLFTSAFNCNASSEDPPGWEITPTGTSLIGCFSEDEIEEDYTAGVWLRPGTDTPIDETDCTAVYYKYDKDLLSQQCSTVTQCSNPPSAPDPPELDNSDHCCDFCVFEWQVTFDCDDSDLSCDTNSNWGDVEQRSRRCLGKQERDALTTDQWSDPPCRKRYVEISDTICNSSSNCEWPSPPDKPPRQPGLDDCCRYCEYLFERELDCNTLEWGDAELKSSRCVRRPNVRDDAGWRNTTDPCKIYIYKAGWSIAGATCDCSGGSSCDGSGADEGDLPTPPAITQERIDDCCTKRCVWRFVAEISDCRKGDGDPELWDIGDAEYIGCLDKDERDDLPLDWVPIDDEESGDPCKRHIYVVDEECDDEAPTEEICPSPPDKPEPPEEGKPDDCCGQCVWIWEAEYDCDDGWDLTSQTADCHDCVDLDTVSSAYEFNVWLDAPEVFANELGDEDCKGWLYTRGEGCRLASGCGPGGGGGETDDCESDDTQTQKPVLPGTDPEEFCCDECVSTWTATWECDAAESTAECECGEGDWVVEFVSTECIEVPEDMEFDEWIETGTCERTYRKKGPACESESDCETPDEPDKPSEEEPAGCECGDIEIEVVGGDGNQNSWWMDTTCPSGSAAGCPGCPGDGIGTGSVSGWGSGLEPCPNAHPLGTFSVRNCCEDADIEITAEGADDVTLSFSDGPCGITGSGSTITIPAGTGTVDIASNWSATYDRDNRGGFVASVSDLPTECPGDDDDDQDDFDTEDDPP